MINFLQTVPIEPQPGFMQQYSFIIMIGLMVLVLWLFMWRPEAKRRKQMQAFRDGLKKGDKVIITYAYTAAQTDVAAGVTNTAAVTADEIEDAVTDTTDPVPVTAYSPDL